MTTVLDEIESRLGWSEIPLRAIGVKVSDVGHSYLEPLSVFLDAGVVPRSSREDNHNQLGESLEKYQRVLPNDLVFNKLRTWQGGFGISDYEGIVSPAYIIVRPNTEVIYPKFLGYLLKSKPYLAELTRLSKWMPPTQFDISWESLRDLQLRIPPIQEQRRIADSLDEQMERVDGLITARQLFLSKLEEYSRSYAFNSLISNVKFDAALGFSIESQNQNWEKVPLGVVCTEVKNKNSKLLENNLLSLSYGRIVRKDIESSEGLLPESFDGYNIIDAGDVVLRLTDLQNDQHSLRVGYAEERGIITSAYTTLRSTSLNSAFLSHQLKAFDAAKFFYALGGGLRQSMKFEDLKKLPILVPPLDEQVAFLTKLDANYQSIRSLRDSAQMQIDELKQFRISIISSKVFGESEENPARRAV